MSCCLPHKGTIAITRAAVLLGVILCGVTQTTASTQVASASSDTSSIGSLSLPSIRRSSQRVLCEINEATPGLAQHESSDVEFERRTNDARPLSKSSQELRQTHAMNNSTTGKPASIQETQTEPLPSPRTLSSVSSHGRSSVTASDSLPQPDTSLSPVYPVASVSHSSTNAAMTHSKHRRILFTCLLAASAGVGDVCSMRRHSGLCVNVCTGNIIRIGTALSTLLSPTRSTNAWNGIGHRDRELIATTSVALPLIVVAGYAVGSALLRLVHHSVVVRTGKMDSWKASPGKLGPIPSTGLDTGDSNGISTLPLVKRVPQTIRESWSKAHGTFRQLSTKSSSTPLNVLVNVVPLITLLFWLADLTTVGSLTATTTAGTDTAFVDVDGMITAKHVWLPVLFQAIAYGIIHMAASDAVGGMVLFAVTGHMANVARTSVDWAHSQLKKVDHTPIATTNTTTLAAIESNNNSTVASIPVVFPGRPNALIVLSFLSGIVLGGVSWDFIMPWIEGTLAKRSIRIPFHTLTGLFYASLFFWYGRNDP